MFSKLGAQASVQQHCKFTVCGSTSFNCLGAILHVCSALVFFRRDMCSKQCKHLTLNHRRLFFHFVKAAIRLRHVLSGVTACKFPVSSIILLGTQAK